MSLQSPKQSNNKKILFLFWSAVIVITIFFGYYLQSQRTQSLFSMLDYYDIKTPKEKKALEFLMKKAAIVKQDESLSEFFKPRTKTEDLFKDLLDFIRQTQAHFTIRKGATERWEVKPEPWMSESPKEIKDALLTLGLINEIRPTLATPDVICILGARASTMQNRLQYAYSLFQKKSLLGKRLVLLAGERKVTKDIDGSEEKLSLIAKKFGISINDLTETHLIKEAYENSLFFEKLPTEVIDTPKGELPRPTTETTLLEFSKWLNMHPEVRTVTFVSNQPHVKYQHAVIKEVLRKENPAIIFDVIGSGVNEDAKVQELVGALGSEIWAKTPYVLAQTKLKIENNDLRKEFLSLFAKQPLIYKNVASLLENN